MTIVIRSSITSSLADIYYAWLLLLPPISRLESSLVESPWHRSGGAIARSAKLCCGLPQFAKPFVFEPHPME